MGGTERVVNSIFRKDLYFYNSIMGGLSLCICRWLLICG